jgi:acyl-CoA synthetase (AMP-forming)/AMP-acid ligase II
MPYALAVAYREERLSWRAVNDRANQCAIWLAAHSVGPGDVVALMMDNRPDYLSMLMGLCKIGAPAALINTNLSGPALAHALRVSRTRKIVAGSEHATTLINALDEEPGDPRLPRPRDLWLVRDDQPGAGDADSGRTIDGELAAASTREQGNGHVPRNTDTFCYIYTSGTTGPPKAAIIRNQRMTGAMVLFGRVMHECGPGDIIYVPLPLYHSSAMFAGWGAALATGAAIALRRKFSASAFFADVREFRATSFLYIGELCRYLLNTPPQPGERDHRLRLGVGNGLRPDIWDAFQKRFGVPLIREFYGATEGNAPTVNLEGRPGMVGRLGRGQALLRCDPATGQLVRTGNGFCLRARPGEVGLMVGRISAAARFDGYADRAATESKILRGVFKASDRYFDSGDLLQLHEDRWLSFADRLGDTFRWKGENVSTNEVGEILNGAAGVLESNVYGVRVAGADGRAGMAALAVDGGFDLDAFTRFVGKSLARYQRPLFLRLLQGGMRITGTFTHQKVDYREEAFDPGRVSDPLYVLVGGRYLPIDANVHRRLEAGELVPG